MAKKEKTETGKPRNTADIGFEKLQEGDGFENDPDAYLEENVFFVPEAARWAKIAADTAGAVRERAAFLLRHRIALWDVLASCDIEGASDSSITDGVPNDFSPLLSNSKISRIFCTGKTAFALYRKYCAEKYGVEYFYLPSTSPANRAAWPDEKLAEEYKKKILPSL